MDIAGTLPIIGDPPLAFRFSVNFLTKGALPNPIDMLFQKVSGLGSTVATTTVEEGGQNLYTQKLPTKVQYDNLILERGLVQGSPLVAEFNIAMSDFKFAPSNVLVILLNHAAEPVASWMFMKAYPVKWSVSDLDAESNSIVIETMELAYQNMQVIRV